MFHLCILDVHIAKNQLGFKSNFGYMNIYSIHLANSEKLFINRNMNHYKNSNVFYM